MGARITVTQKEYDSYVKELRELQEMYRDALTEAQKVVRLDNGICHDVHENAQIGVTFLRQAIADIQEKIESFTISDEPRNENVVGFNDTILLKFLDDNSEQIVKLVQRCMFKNELIEVSLNSPIGNAIYGAKIGNIVTYAVDDKEFEVEIMGKI